MTNAAETVITTPSRPAGGWASKSEFVLALVADNVTELVGGGGDSENEKESVLTDCMDMMDVRGNTFTAILRVRSIKDREPGGSTPNGEWDGEDVDPVLAEQEAVAQIWRDPVTKETRVTFFRWLTTGL